MEISRDKNFHHFFGGKKGFYEGLSYSHGIIFQVPSTRTFFGLCSFLTKILKNNKVVPLVLKKTSKNQGSVILAGTTIDVDKNASNHQKS